jgi:hypothetical protein
MLKGRLCAAGELNVDGDIMTGVFIEVSREDLRNHVHILYCDVEVHAAKAGGAPAEQTNNIDYAAALQAYHEYEDLAISRKDGLSFERWCKEQHNECFRPARPHQ